MPLGFHDVTLRWPDGDLALDGFSTTIPDGRSGVVGKEPAGRSVQAAGAVTRRPSGSCSTSHGMSSLQK